MSRRKQSNPKPLKPGEDNEWSTNDEENATATDGDCPPVAAGAVQDTTTAAATMKICAADAVKTERQPSPTPPPPQHLGRTSTAPLEPDEPSPPPPSVQAADPPVKRLRLNPNYATDPAARRSPGDEPPAANALQSSAVVTLQSLPPPPPPPPPPAEPVNAHNIQQIPRAIQIFICNPCGIRFSSLSTLDAHQTYYCSRRHKKDSESDDAKMPIVVESDETGLGNDTDSRPSSVEQSAAKSIRTGKQYKCPHCSYSADKKVSLNRHMRMHSISPVSAMQSPPCPSDSSVSDPSVVDRYCQNCDIRFSNLRTYQAHKTHYCNTRHVVKPTQSVSPISNNNHHYHNNNNNNNNNNKNNPSPVNTAQPPTYLALPTNPVIVVPYTLVQNASVLSAVTDAGPSPPADTACIVLSDGTLQPIAQALQVPNKFNIIAANNNNNNNHHQHHHHNNNNNNNDVDDDDDNEEDENAQGDDSRSPPERYFSPSKKSEPMCDQPHQEAIGKRPIAMVVQPSSPLDLRLKHVRTSRDEEEKENRRSDGNVTDAEDIVCAPSIPCMILSPSTSPPSTSTGNHKTVRQQQHPVNGVVVLKDAAEDAARNGGGAAGKFSVSSLLHASNLQQLQERVLLRRDTPPGTVESAGGMIVHHQQHQLHHNHHLQPHRYNPSHKSVRHHAQVAPPPAVGLQHQQPPPTTGIHHQQQQQQQRNVDHLLGPAAAAVLPYFTSEMTLRLAAAANANPATADGALTHQFFLKQGPSKCESCNIVFCKYENFLAHKKHYCASRPPQPQPQPQPQPPPPPPPSTSFHGDADNADYKTSPEGSPGGPVKPPLTVVSPQSSKDSVSPTPQQLPAPPQQVMQLKPPIIQFICSTCGVKFSSFDNLTTHQAFYCPNRLTGHEVTIAAPTTDKLLSKCPKCKMTVEGGYHHCQAANCWKCPVCGAICPSASAAQKHLDNHNGIKAFVCTICQYKGNTLRGLRTHIRMHFNKRLIPDLMEEDYVTCVIDENSTTTTTSTADVGGTGTAAKMNAEKPSTIATVKTAADDQPKELVTVKQEPSNAEAGAMSSEAAEEFEPETSSSADGAGDRPVQHHQAVVATVKRGGNATAKYCKACEISFNYLSTFIAHKKYYCRNSTEYKQTAENAKTATVTS